MGKVKFTPVACSDYLDSEEVITAYLTAAREDRNPSVLALAVPNVARVHGATPDAASLQRHAEIAMHVSELPAEVTDELGTVAIPESAVQFNDEYEKK